MTRRVMEDAAILKTRQRTNAFSTAITPPPSILQTKNYLESAKSAKCYKGKYSVKYSTLEIEYFNREGSDYRLNNLA